jgi:hypothetical protein
MLARARANAGHGPGGNTATLPRAHHQSRRQAPSSDGTGGRCGYDPDLQGVREGASKLYLRSRLVNLRNKQAGGDWYWLLCNVQVKFLDRASTLHVLDFIQLGVVVLVDSQDLDM